MNITEKLVDQHIREYESRLKHLNELYVQAERASAKLDDGHALKSELQQYRDQHDDLAGQAVELKKLPLGHWREEMIQSAGPLGILDILAQKVEDLIERIEK